MMTKYTLWLFTLMPLSPVGALEGSAAPSAGTAVVLPGLHQTSTDLSGQPLSEQEVIDWEIDHSNIVFGSYAERSDNERVSSVGYMYNQKLEMDGGWQEEKLRVAAELAGIDYESFFLHYAEDTIVAEVDTQHGSNTSLNRKPMIVGYTASEDHAGFLLYQSPPWGVDAFEHYENGGGLYVYHTEKYDQLHFEFSTTARGGSFVIEYPSAIDHLGRVTAWSSLDIITDRTRGFTRDGYTLWSVPNDWKRATTHDGSGSTYGGGQYFGSAFVRDGGRAYVIRVRWVGDKKSKRPFVNNIQLKDSFPVMNEIQEPTNTADGSEILQWRKIRGFDHSADANSDGVLSNSEYKRRSNKSATARFKWESRVIPFGRMWNQNSSWALTNLANPDFAQAMKSYYLNEWTNHGLNGAYNDDSNKLLGANQFEVYSGGKLSEIDLVVGSSQADTWYQELFATFLKRLADELPNSLISINIGTANLFGRNGQNHLTDAGSLYLREHYLFPSTGFSGYAGIAKFWDNSVLAQNGQKVLFQATTRYGRTQHFGNTQDNWQYDQYSSLAIYYLHHHQGLSYFNQWNSSYIYGSDNTSETNYWKSGIAKNIAYQPSHLLAIDIGVPADTIPDGFKAIPMMMSTKTPSPADYTLVGDASMNQLMHSDLPNGVIEVRPTYTYFLQRSEKEVVAGGPEEMVLAREFTKGKVLYRTDFHGKNANFYSSETVNVNLAQPMKPVLPDGTIGDYTLQVALAGYEGLILLY